MKYVLGLDGGGTKTECVLMDAVGTIVARSFSGPSNPSRVGVESATGEILKAAEICMREARIAQNSVAVLCAGLAGTGKPEMKEGMKASLAGVFPGVEVKLRTDLEIGAFRGWADDRPCRGDRLRGDWARCARRNLAHGRIRPIAQ
jgi:N-acetylglucosamine kinase-like BadF-type ATPase